MPGKACKGMKTRGIGTQCGIFPEKTLILKIGMPAYRAAARRDSSAGGDFSSCACSCRAEMRA